MHICVQLPPVMHCPRLKRTSSNARHVDADSDTWNSTSFDVPKGSMYCSDTAAMTDVTKPRHMTSLSFENVSSSSRPKSTPPRGLPKATDTPAAAAAASSLRLRAEQHKHWSDRARDRGAELTFVLPILLEHAGEEERPAAGDVNERAFLAEGQAGCYSERETESLDEEHPGAKESVKNISTQNLAGGS